MTLSGKITGPGGLVVGKIGAGADQYGPIAIAGADSNDYGGDTAIDRGTTYLQKSGGAIAIPGNVSISPSGTSSTGQHLPGPQCEQSDRAVGHDDLRPRPLDARVF